MRKSPFLKETPVALHLPLPVVQVENERPSMKHSGFCHVTAWRPVSPMRTSPLSNVVRHREHFERPHLAVSTRISGPLLEFMNVLSFNCAPARCRRMEHFFSKMDFNWTTVVRRPSQKFLSV